MGEIQFLTTNAWYTFDGCSFGFLQAAGFLLEIFIAMKAYVVKDNIVLHFADANSGRSFHFLD